jgi:hypothetical protein
LAVWVAAAFSVGLPVAAIAAEGTLPGDLLYPVKVAVEPIRSVFDSDVAAVHRVEELERIAESDAPESDLEQAIDRASAAVDEAGTPELEQRFERVRDQIRDRRSGEGTLTDETREPASTREGDRSTVTDRPATTESTTTTAGRDSEVGERQSGSDESGPTTTAARNGTTSTSTHSGGSEDGRVSGDG